MKQICTLAALLIALAAPSVCIAEPLAVCSLIKTADVAKSFGEPFSDPIPMPSFFGSSCEYDAIEHDGTKAISVDVSVDVDAVPFDPLERLSQERRNMNAMGRSTVDVLGVGDGAVWGTKAMDQLTTAQLFVHQRGTTTLVITVYSNIQAPSMLDSTKALALIMLSRI